MNKIELVAEERQKIIENPDLILLDRELLLALLKNSDFPDEENLIDIRNIFLTIDKNQVYLPDSNLEFDHLKQYDFFSK